MFIKQYIMHIEINDNTPLREIKAVFSAYYPFLKLEFFKKPHRRYELSDEKFMVKPDLTVGAIKQTHVSGIIEMFPSSKVVDVEKEFEDRFGLIVQVYRMDKNTWKQTAMDNMTLKELNEIGRSSSDEFIVLDYEKGFTEIDDRPNKLF